MKENIFFFFFGIKQTIQIENRIYRKLKTETYTDIPYWSKVKRIIAVTKRKTSLKLIAEYYMREHETYLIC